MAIFSTIIRSNAKSAARNRPPTVKREGTHTASSLVGIVPKRSKMNPLGKRRKLFRKEAMVKTRDNWSSWPLQSEREGTR